VAHDFGIRGLRNMSIELLSLTPDGFERDIHRDMSKLAEELADVLVVCAIIAFKQGVDLNEANARKHKKRVEKLLNRFHDGHYPVSNVRPQIRRRACRVQG
jgi:NTP pyrophosphatase (non-canonical NTP hydrolase)